MNPVSAFTEYGHSVRQRTALEMVSQSGPSHKPKFTFVAKIGHRSFPPVVTHNKKEGRRAAAKMALDVLATEGTFRTSQPSTNCQPVLRNMKGKKTSIYHRLVTQSLLRTKRKGGVLKAKDQPSVRMVVSNGPVAEQPESGQHDSRAGNSKQREEMVPDKNPVSAFMEYGQSVHQTPTFEVVGQSGPSHKPVFTFAARIGQHVFPAVVSHTKKDGKRSAAEVALNVLAAEGALQNSSRLSSHFQIVNQGLHKTRKKGGVEKAKERSTQGIVRPSSGGLGGLENLRSAQHDSITGRRATRTYQPTEFLNKNPISAFVEYGQSIHQKPVLEELKQSGRSKNSMFTFVARIGGRTFPQVATHNKKDGRREAAEVALRILAAEGAFQFSPRPSSSSQPGFGGASFYDRIASLSHQAFSNLVVDIPECFTGKKVISALILKMDQFDEGRVIALGTGNRCVTGDKLSLEGQTVQDSHAEVVTRRAFMRYLYRQVKMYRTHPEKTILSPSPSGKLRLREGCSLHLYISTAPCGDGAQFSWTDNQGNKEGPSGDLDFSGHANHCPTISKNTQGLLRTKMELGEGTIPIQEKNPIQTWDAIMQNQQRLRTMSCSDKVCRWNILGLQGSLLTHFVDPVYLSSLTLGTLYHHGHLSRAVCCRMARSLKSLEDGAWGLPPGYHINHPQLGHVTSPEPPRGTEKTKEFSVNWYAGCDNAEVTDGTVGRIKGVVPSRLCKMNLLKEFIEVCTLYNISIEHRGLDSYNNIKLTAEDFQRAKAFMKNLFHKGKYGTWVEKPIEVDMFPP